MKKHLLFSAAITSGLLIFPAAPLGAINKKNSQSMTKQEEEFARQLSELHLQIYTTIFTPELRQEAIYMMGDYQDETDEMTPTTADMAVEQTIMNHRDGQKMERPSLK